jgi:hypothetical protein
VKLFCFNQNGAFTTWRWVKISFGFSGPADANSFDLITHLPSSTTIKAKHTPERAALEKLYEAIHP